MRTFLASAAVLVGLATASLAADMVGTAKIGDITIHDAWARASLGAAPNSAAYMRLETAGSEPDRLTGGSTPAAEKVQLHTHLMEDGIARMRPVDAIEVAPGTPAVLEPGGLHVMLVGLTGPLEAGTSFELTLAFETAGEVTLEVPVEALTGGMGQGAMDENTDHGQGTH